MAWILKGGVFIWLILLCSVLALWFLLDRAVHFWLRIPRINRSLDTICRDCGQLADQAVPGYLTPILVGAVAERHLRSPDHQGRRPDRCNSGAGWLSVLPQADLTLGNYLCSSVAHALPQLKRTYQVEVG